MRGVPRARRAISAAPLASRRDVEDGRRAADDGVEVAGAVVVQPGDEAEPVPQRTGDEPGAGGGAHQREPGQVQADGAGARALAEDDVELEVLHRRVQDLLHRPAQAVDLVDEEDVALGQVGQDGGQVAGPDQGRAGRDAKAGAHLVGHDPGQRGLAQSRAGRRTAGGRRAGPAAGPPPA